MNLCPGKPQPRLRAVSHCGTPPRLTGVRALFFDFGETRTPRPRLAGAGAGRRKLEGNIPWVVDATIVDFANLNRILERRPQKENLPKRQKHHRRKDEERNKL